MIDIGVPFDFAKTTKANGTTMWHDAKNGSELNLTFIFV